MKLFELKTGHKEAEEKKVDIKLFEFNSNQELKSGDQSSEEKHLARPTIYLNICHSDKVKKPLKRDRSFADPDDESTWAILPISYGKESETEETIIYDAHLNSCIFKR